MEPYRQQLTRVEAQAQQDPLFFRDERSLPPNPHLLVLTPWPSLTWSWPPDRPPLGPDRLTVSSLGPRPVTLSLRSSPLTPLSWSWPPDPLFLGPHPLTPSPFGRGGTRGWGRGGCATAFRPLAGGGPLGMWAAAAGGRTGALRTSFAGCRWSPRRRGVSHPRPIMPLKRPTACSLPAASWQGWGVSLAIIEEGEAWLSNSHSRGSARQWRARRRRFGVAAGCSQRGGRETRCFRRRSRGRCTRWRTGGYRGASSRCGACSWTVCRARRTGWSLRCKRRWTLARSRCPSWSWTSPSMSRPGTSRPTRRLGA